MVLLLRLVLIEVTEMDLTRLVTSPLERPQKFDPVILEAEGSFSAPGMLTQSKCFVLVPAGPYEQHTVPCNVVSKKKSCKSF